MEEGSMFRSLLAILQWWGFNVTVIIMNKWIFQISFFLNLEFGCVFTSYVHRLELTSLSKFSSLNH
ncbi:unnamed protein product [Arabidopsis halleri]